MGWRRGSEVDVNSEGDGIGADGVVALKYGGCGGGWGYGRMCHGVFPFRI